MMLPSFKMCLPPSFNLWSLSGLQPNSKYSHIDNEDWPQQYPNLLKTQIRPLILHQVFTVFYSMKNAKSLPVPQAPLTFAHRLFVFASASFPQFWWAWLKHLAGFVSFDLYISFFFFLPLSVFSFQDSFIPWVTFWDSFGKSFLIVWFSLEPCWQLNIYDYYYLLISVCLLLWFYFL